MMHIPSNLQKRQGWLLWVAKRRPGGKVDKIPHYVDGTRRSGHQGSDEDRAKLASFNDAVVALGASKGRFAGIGLVMLPEFGIVGLDFDRCIDDKGRVAQWVLDLVQGTYAERSPSGKGVRAFFTGAFPDFKNHAEGIEVFHAKGFLTVTSNALRNTQPAEAPLPDAVREALEGFRPSNTPGIYLEGGDRDAPYLATDVDALTLRDLKQALDFLPSDDRDLWTRFAHALKPLGPLGRELWEEWSKKSSKYDPRDAARVWRSVRSSRIGYRVIFAAACRAGWRRPASNTAQPAALREPKAARDLMAKKFDPMRWIIEDILPEGCYLLSARPKVGKSWLGLQFCVAITENGTTLGKRAAGGSVLYLALEDNERRFQARLAKHEIGQYGDIKKFFFDNEWPKIGDGGAEALEQWLRAHEDARLIVVDSLEKVRPKRTRDVYADDYAATQALKALSDKYKVTILIICHNRKGKSETGDPIELINASLGLSGGCDGALVIERARGKSDANFYVMGRDIEHEPEDGYVIRFNRDYCKWEMLGDAAALASTSAQQAVLDAIRDAGKSLAAAQVGKVTGRGREAARHILNDLVDAGKLIVVDNSRPLEYEFPAELAAAGDGP